MKYLLLVYASVDRLWELTTLEQERLWSGLERLAAEADGRAFLFPLEQAAALSLRRRSDGLQLHGLEGDDGEQLQGCVLVEAVDRVTAVDMAARLAAARVGSIEVRPVRAFNDS